MKTIATLIGIAALLTLPAAANADPCSYIWLGGTSQWSLEDNWDGDLCFDYPGYDSSDSATIDDTSVDVPELDGNYTIARLTMGNSAELDVASHTLTVHTGGNTGTFTVEGDSAITISGSSTSCGVTADRFEMDGGTNGSTMTVSSCTVQTQ